MLAVWSARQARPSYQHQRPQQDDAWDQEHPKDIGMARRLIDAADADGEKEEGYRNTGCGIDFEHQNEDRRECHETGDSQQRLTLPDFLSANRGDIQACEAVID
jgi:hypothetical protein